MLQTWNPWQDLEDVQRRLSRAVRSEGGSSWAPATDIVEDENGLYLHLDLPKVDEGSLEVSSEGSRLSVKATRRALGGEGKTVHYQGRLSGAFSSTFRVPTTFDLAKVAASYDSGVLTLFVPRSESTRPRKIDVVSGGKPEGSTDIQAEPKEKAQDTQYA